MMMILKNNHHQRGTQHLALIGRRQEPQRRGCAARERNEPGIAILTGFEPPTSALPGTVGTNPTPRPMKDTGSIKFRPVEIVSVVGCCHPEDSVQDQLIQVLSFREILVVPDPRNRAWQKKQLGKIVARIRDSSVGRADYSSVDFLEDVKCACAREGVVFNDDLYNELVR